MRKVVIEVPDVPGRLLVLSEKYIKEHQLEFSMFTQKFIGEVDLYNAVVHIIEEDQKGDPNDSSN